MPIDAGIVGRLQPVQVPDQMNMLAKAMQIKEAQSNQQINALKMDEYKRGLEDQNALRTALSQPGADPYSSLLKIGKVKEATEYAKGQADIGKTKAEAEYKAVEVAHKRVDSWGQAMGWLRQNPTPENAVASIQHLVTMGVMPQEQAQAAIAAVQKNPTPQGIAQFADMGFRTALQAKDQLPKFQTNNIGGQTVTQQIDPVTGRAVVASAIQNTQSPDNIATNVRVAADAAASRAQAERHFQAGQSAPEYKQDADGNYIALPKKPGAGPIVATPVVDASGKRVGGSSNKLGEAAKKQVAGIDSLSAAIEEYKAELKNWRATDALRPDKRAAMGTKYNNMMLQAKEAYNLGVLNGPDFQILTTVVTDPMSVKGAITSNEALSNQASELDRMMQRTRAAVANQGKGGGAPANTGGATGNFGSPSVDDLLKKYGGK